MSVWCTAGATARHDNRILWLWVAAFAGDATLQSRTGRVLAMAMSVDLPAVEQAGEHAPASRAPTRLSRYIGPALGLLLPVTLALAWEIVVGLGYSNGRLVPPPSKVFAT